MLVEETLFGTVDKVKVAIARLKLNEPPEGYYVAFSGGKDSCVILDLCKRAGVKFDAHYNLTTVDPPELVYFIRNEYPEVEKHFPEKTMWQLIEQKGILPTPMVRYCCAELKERGGKGRFIITGVRHEESVKRSGRKLVETCKNGGGKRFLHIVIDWDKDEVWEYIHKYNVSYCSLYDEGFNRIGCVLCPFQTAKARKADIERYPRIVECYHNAINRGYRAENSTFQNADEMWEWWLYQGYRREHKTEDERQTAIYGLMADESITQEG